MCMCVGCVVWGEWMLTCYWYMFAYANVMYILALTFSFAWHVGCIQAVLEISGKR